MRSILLLIISIFILSCSSEKVIQLPSVGHTEITNVLDVSAAYIFYDETKVNSVELNRKNLIISTNWLVNVDKRLTLDQAIPKIQFLQNKRKKASMHKNEAARNYYTCNDTTIKNLGFIDFTDVYYNLKACKPFPKDSLYVFNNNNFKTYKDPYIQKDSNLLEMPLFFDLDHLIYTNDAILKEQQVKNYLNELLKSRNENQIKIITTFNRNLNFQEYINYKSFISTLNTEAISISTNEPIY